MTANIRYFCQRIKFFCTIPKIVLSLLYDIFTQSLINTGHGSAPVISFLPPDYSWKTYGAMNVEIWKRHQNTPLITAKQLLQDSHQKVMSMADKFTNEELFTKKYFPWTGTTDLGSYFVSTTASHYDWAIKKIKLHCKKVG